MISIPLSLYVHLPWCLQKCPYCDFNSHALKEALPEEAYIAALQRDLQEEAHRVGSTSLVSIFFGGGTPSLFSARAFEKILNEISHYFHLPSNIEITLEANPSAIEQTRFKNYRALGINRISLGIQSFNPHQLKKLGRAHDDVLAHEAIRAVMAAGFENFNLDLMHGLPDQTFEEAIAELNTAFTYDPPHLSWYQLTLEPNTVFFKYPPSLPDEDHIAQWQEAGLSLLKEKGYVHYEVSAYSKPGKQCAHNLHYWQFGDYLGIGAGAHGKWTHPLTKIPTRRMKTRQPKDYLNLEKSCIASESTVPQKQQYFEFMLNALRLQHPIPWTLFEERTQCHQKDLIPILKKLEQQQLTEPSTEMLQLSKKGRLFLDDVVSYFL